MKILVTGGLGYIGSHTVLCLLEQGYEPIIVDDLSNSSFEILNILNQISGKDIEFHELDLKRIEGLEDLFNDKNFDGIIHFAAYKALGESMHNPFKYYENNLISLLNTLKLSIENNVRNFIFSSSCTVYGQPKDLPINEDLGFLSTPSPYGKTKQMCENILEDVSKSEEIKIYSLRYFNPIGAHKSGNLGEYQKSYPQNLVPLLTQSATGKIDKLTVHGGDYDTYDGSPIRDYIDINDLARAHVRALTHLIGNKKKRIHDYFNLGLGKGVSVLELISTFEKVTGAKVEYEIQARRPGDVKEVFADCSKAKEVLGWEPKISLDKSLLSAYKWEIKSSELTIIK
jgi:UDP-glucose 4-epimerase